MNRSKNREKLQSAFPYFVGLCAVLFVSGCVPYPPTGGGGYEAPRPSIEWVAGSNGNIPGGAIVGGSELSGASLYVCRAQYNGEMHVGKIGKGLKGCHMGYGGREVSNRSYEVAVGSARWLSGSNGSIPPGAFEAGWQDGGRTLYACKGNISITKKVGLFKKETYKITQPGKIGPHLKNCNIGYGGVEKRTSSYYVMVAN